MKVSNPSKYFPNVSDTSTYNKLQAAAKLVSRGDILVKYALTDSESEADWSNTMLPESKWYKVSFDCGLTYPIKMSIDTSLSYSVIVAKNEILGSTYSITFEDESSYLACQGSPLVVTVTTASGQLKTIDEVLYKFNNGKCDVDVTSLNLDSTDVGVKFTFMLAANVNALGVPVPVYITYASAIPTILDDTYGFVNYLDDNYTNFTINTKLVNVNKISLEVVSASAFTTGNIVLRIENAINGSSFDRVITVNTSPSWIEIVPDAVLNGEIKITRLINDSRDTLKSSEDVAITTIVNNIKLEQN